MEGRELEFMVRGLRLTGLEWGPEDGKIVLAIHGWLDNAASFAPLAERMPEVRLMALDLAGHGRSDWRSEDAEYHFANWARDVLGVLLHLPPEPVVLMGHSMGAGVAPIVAAVAPERIERLILIESLGPLSTPAVEAAEQFTKALLHRRRLRKRFAPVFPDLEHAVLRRMEATDLRCKEAVTALVSRGTHPYAGGDDGVQFSFDPRLRMRSLVRFTEGQVLAFLRSVSCPVTFVRAEDGYSVDPEVFAARLKAVPQCVVHQIAGGHHVHLDDPERVAPLVRQAIVGDGP